jgi:GrpB-like predicted nucleotidyltransferase (UPF0157 family)
VLRDHDPNWPRLADVARRELIDRLSGVFIEIEHIGSTAVPGLAGKPIIDLMACVDSLDAVLRAEAGLNDLGYRRADTGMPNRLFYARDDGDVRTHHLHVVTSDTWAGRNERLLRDLLRDSAPDRERYARLKRDLAAVHGVGDAYTRGKTGLVQELVDRARLAKGLPPVPVWEE